MFQVLFGRGLASFSEIVISERSIVSGIYLARILLGSLRIVHIS